MNLRLREKHHVSFESIDFTGKLSINALCNYMQIIAGNHAAQLGFSYYNLGEAPKYYWILSRVRYEIDTYPRLEEDMSLETYPGGYDKLYAVRLFDLLNEEGKQVGRILGDYILMDAVKNRPARIKGAEGPLAFLDFPYEGEKLPKLPVIKQGKREILRTAYYSELDLNAHMNNAHYIRWIVDMLPIELLKDMEIATLQINYNTSVTYGVEVKVILDGNPEEGYLVAGNSLDGEVNYFTASMTLRKSIK